MSGFSGSVAVDAVDHELRRGVAALLQSGANMGIEQVEVVGIRLCDAKRHKWRAITWQDRHAKRRGGRW
ncbi:hypothetical protein A8D95_24790 [Burkholderia cenocepacia]|nr:hypothetical protein A8D84_18400 [Burkholderia cenocepacia]ONP39326.1 hypothetical protein A8D85_15495 [Burkholderia cenocepacia]ONP50420.1 hypothetical protein A8D87_14220 [Burkholderia cenocepacia]ONP59742.1 hypothetical protein A8D89_14655 [Burkholderia cenocepacia]ONP66337.1 hypothetical protein A8D88_17350 [Burkholderia cenocepacia]